MYWVMSFQRWACRLFFGHLAGLGAACHSPLASSGERGIEGLADPRDRPPVPHHRVVLTGPTWDPGPRGRSCGCWGVLGKQSDVAAETWRKGSM